MKIFALIALLILTSCAPSREIQTDGDGSDEMLKSPCACVPLPYDAPAYRWVS